MTQDDAGRIYRNTNESSLHVTSCRRRTSRATRTCCARAAATKRSRDDENVGQHRLAGAAESRDEPRLPGRHRSSRTARLATFTSVCAPLIYRGDRLPAELYGNVFVAEPAANLVSRIILERRRDDAARAEGLRAGGVPRVHRRALPAGLPLERARRHALHRRHVSRRHPAARRHHRVPARPHPHAQARAADRPRPHLPRRARDDAARHRRRRWRSATPAQLVDALSHPNGWWRDTAQRLLVERGDQVGRAGLDEAGDERARTGGRGCTRCGRSTASTRIDAATVTKALEDPSRDVRIAGDPASPSAGSATRTARCRPRC